MSQQDDIIIDPQIQRKRPESAGFEDDTPTSEGFIKIRPYFATFEPLSAYKQNPSLNRLNPSRERADSISSGNFGNLVRAANQQYSSDKELAQRCDRQVKLNLYQVGPETALRADERCNAWREYEF